MRTPRSSCLALALATYGCSEDQSSLSHPTGATILGVSKVNAPVDETTGLVLGCDYEASETNFTTDILVDTALSPQLTLPFTVRNDAAQVRDEVRPLRMQLTWACEPSGMSGALGPLIVPALRFESPFCRSEGEAREDAVDADFVSASGPSIAGAGGLGVVRAQVVPVSLGSAINQAFEIAALAERCCFDTRAANCDGKSSGPACTRLTELFLALDPSGTSLEVAVDSGPSEDLVRFQAFALFDGNNLCARDRTVCDASPLLGPAYRMRLHGRMELLRVDGALVSSNERTTDIDLCRNCGQWDGRERLPASRAERHCFAR